MRVVHETITLLLVLNSLICPTERESAKKYGAGEGVARRVRGT